MKLQKKLAVVLTAAMMLSAAPTQVFAYSESYVTREVTVKKDGAIGFTKTTTGSALQVNVGTSYLRIDPQDGFDSFISLYLENAEWADWNDMVAGIKYPGQPVNAKGDVLDEDGEVLVAASSFEKELTLNINGEYDEDGPIVIIRYGADELGVTTKKEEAGRVNVTEKFSLPIMAIATGGKATVEIDGAGTTIKSEKHVIATTPTNDSQSLALKIDEDSIPRFYDEGELAPIVLEELYIGALAEAKEEDRTVTLTLDHTDFDFDRSMKSVKVQYSRGFDGTATLPVTFDKYDDQTISFVLPAEANTARGTLKITGIKVETNLRSSESIETGDLNVDVDSEIIGNATYKMATIAEFGGMLYIKDDKTVDLKAGEKTSIKVVLEETVKDSIREGRTIDFELNDGYFGEFDEDLYDKDKTKDETYQIAKLVTVPSTMKIVDALVDKNDNFTGFTVEVLSTEADDISKYELTLPVCAPVSIDGDIILTASGRALDQDAELVLAKVEKSVDVTVETAKIVSGKKDQKGGSIVLKETAKNKLNKGKVYIEIEDETGLVFVDAPTVTVEGDTNMKVSEAKIVKNKTKGTVAVEFEVLRTSSKEAATITISDFTITASGVVPDGKINAIVYGPAIGDYGQIDVENFIEVGELAVPEAEKNVVKFTIGQQNFVQNGEAKLMDAAPFLTAKGRTMVPLRYVAEAFGVGPQQIIFYDGTATILFGTRTIQVKNNSNMAILNGVSIPMDEKMQIINSRTYVPIGEIARLLDIQVEWDQATQSATFTK